MIASPFIPQTLEGGSTKCPMAGLEGQARHGTRIEGHAMGTARHRNGMAQEGTAWHGTILHDTAQHGMGPSCVPRKPFVPLRTMSRCGECIRLRLSCHDKNLQYTLNTLALCTACGIIILRRLSMARVLHFFGIWRQQISSRAVACDTVGEEGID